MHFFLRFYFTGAAFLTLVAGAHGHPIPDIPVRSSFDESRTCQVTVEIDIRCFSTDPLNEPFLLKWVLDEMDASELNELKANAAALIDEGVAFRFAPQGSIAPEFDFAFTSVDGVPLENIDDAVMLTGTWKTAVPPGTEGYQVEALPTGKFDLVFRNTINGRNVERFQVLFPGETSYLLELYKPVAAAVPTALPASATADSNSRTPPTGYLPIILISVIIAASLIALAHARRNRNS